MTRRRSVSALAMAGLMPLAACGSSESAPSASTVPSATSVPATSAAPSTAAPSAGASGSRRVTAQASVPTTPARPRTGSVIIIGDSLTNQSENGQKDVTASLVKAGWAQNKICFSGVDGRTIVSTIPGGAPDSVAEANRCRKQVGEPEVWIVALVTNDLDSSPARLTADMGKLLGTNGAKGNVVWVNAGRRDTAELGTKLDANDTVAKVVAARPHTRLADWYAFLQTQPDQAAWWVPDGTHMTRQGYAVRNGFIAAQAQLATA